MFSGGPGPRPPVRASDRPARVLRRRGATVSRGRNSNLEGTVLDAQRRRRPARDARMPARRHTAAPGARTPAARWSLAATPGVASAPLHDPTMAWSDGSAQGSVPGPPCRWRRTAARGWPPARSRQRFPADRHRRPPRTAGTAVRPARTARSSDGGGGTGTAGVTRKSGVAAGGACNDRNSLHAVPGIAPADSDTPARFPAQR